MKLYAACSIYDGKLDLRNLYKTENQFLSCYQGSGDLVEIEVFTLNQLTYISSTAKDGQSHYNGSALQPKDYRLLRRNYPCLTIVKPGNQSEYARKDTIIYKPAESYNAFLNSIKLVAGIRNLLTDYQRPMSRSWLGFIVHPNRHHKATAAIMVRELAGKDSRSARIYLNDKRIKLLASGANKDGSLIRRIEFAIAAIDKQLSVKATPSVPAESLAPKA